MSRGRRAGTPGNYGRIVVAGTALAFALGACGGSDDSATDATVTPGSAAPATATANGGHSSSSYGSHPSTTTAPPVTGSAGASAGGAAASATTVTIENFAFSPQTVTFKVGQTVTVVNNDSAPHTWTSEEGGFDTGRLEQGQSATVTVGKAGTFTVICQIHPSMTGTVTVTA